MRFTAAFFLNFKNVYVFSKKLKMLCAVFLMRFSVADYSSMYVVVGEGNRLTHRKIVYIDMCA